MKLPYWLQKILNPNIVAKFGDQVLVHQSLSPEGEQNFRDTADLRKWISKNKCPDCRHEGFYSGPEGGMSMNIMCANEACCSAFNVAAIGGEIISAERISNGYWNPPIKRDDSGKVVA